jgi:hypothetical protein
MRKKRVRKAKVTLKSATRISGSGATLFIPLGLPYPSHWTLSHVAPQYRQFRH